MQTEKVCPWCGDLFTPEHGNDAYCCPDHQEQAKKERQKRKRDPVSRFFPILMRNHEAIGKLFADGKMELTAEEVIAYGIDLSLCRHMQPPLEHQGKLLLDFGQYYLITETNFLTFKIFKHDTATSINAN